MTSFWFPRLEQGCQELGLNFIRESGGNDEYSPEIVYFLTGMDNTASIAVDRDHSPMLSADAIIQTLNEEGPGALMAKAQAIKTIASGDSIGPFKMSPELMAELKADYAQLAP